LISKSFVARQQIDDAAIGEAVLQDVVLHNLVVAVSIYTDANVKQKEARPANASRALILF